jgi:hypothetical protein
MECECECTATPAFQLVVVVPKEKMIDSQRLHKPMSVVCFVLYRCNTAQMSNRTRNEFCFRVDFEQESMEIFRMKRIILNFAYTVYSMLIQYIYVYFYDTTHIKKKRKNKEGF